jgi:hypothetical protein
MIDLRRSRMPVMVQVHREPGHLPREVRSFAQVVRLGRVLAGDIILAEGAERVGFKGQGERSGTTLSVLQRSNCLSDSLEVARRSSVRIISDARSKSKPR